MHIFISWWEPNVPTRLGIFNSFDLAGTFGCTPGLGVRLALIIRINNYVKAKFVCVCAAIWRKRSFKTCLFTDALGVALTGTVTHSNGKVFTNVCMQETVNENILKSVYTSYRKMCVYRITHFICSWRSRSCFCNRELDSLSSANSRCVYLN